jgi:hypothetical protein
MQKAQNRRNWLKIRSMSPMPRKSRNGALFVVCLAHLVERIGGVLLRGGGFHGDDVLCVEKNCAFG